MRASLLLPLTLATTSLCACAALLGVELDVEQAAATGDASASLPSSCSAKSCEQLGVRCGTPDDGCGATLRCELDCGDGCTPSPRELACAGRCGERVATGCDDAVHACAPCDGESSSSSGSTGSSGRTGEPEPELGELDAGGSSSSSGSACVARPQSEVCAGRCDELVSDGCNGHYTCTAPAGQVCYQGQPCTRRTSCAGECGFIAEQDNCGFALSCRCSDRQCCQPGPAGALGQCVPQNGPEICFEIAEPVLN